MEPKLAIALGLVALSVAAACGGKIVTDARAQRDDPTSEAPPGGFEPPSSPLPASPPAPPPPRMADAGVARADGLACLSWRECAGSRPACCIMRPEDGGLWTSACQYECGYFGAGGRDLCTTDDDCSDGESCKIHHCDDGRTYRFCGEETVHCYSP